MLLRDPPTARWPRPSRCIATLGMLSAARAAHGDVFTIRLATVRPIVVVAAASEVEGLLHADPASAHAGEARRRILPADRHTDGWPRDRPFRLLPRMRALVDEVFVRCLLGAYVAGEQRDAMIDSAAQAGARVVESVI